VNWYDFRIDSGAVEGVINKIKDLKKRAYGFHDMEFFKLQILAISEPRPKPASRT
jgi:transposase